jgi:hypothetical protein
MLRANAKQAVVNALEDSYFGLSNFSIQYGSGKPFWVKILFIPNVNFYFLISDGTEAYPFYLSETPGLKFLSAQSSIHSEYEKCIVKIPEWICRIKEEVIDANPFTREFQKVRKQLEERMDELTENQEEFFSAAEAEKLKEKLQEFSSKLDAVSQTNEELKAAISNQKIKIDELIEAANSVNKGTWFRMAGSRLLSTAKAVVGSKEGREFALEAAKRVLLDGPK